MIRREATCRTPLALAVALVAAGLGCQQWDRMRPSGSAEGERGTLLKQQTGLAALPRSGSGDRLTNEIALERIGRIEEASGQQRLDLIDDFLSDWPEARVIWQLHQLAGAGYQEIGEPARAADAYEMAIAVQGTDVTGLPVYTPELAYRVGWARYEAGDRQGGLDWLVRATFVNDGPQVEQALSYLYSEEAEGAVGFAEWLRRRRGELAVRMPDFELPGLGGGSVVLSQQAGHVTLVNFWSPT